jgi:hypothetical protein
VENEALEKAEQECLADSESRARRREREAEKYAEMDQKYIGQFALRVRELFPRCPSGREIAIAQHACLKYSGRVGRSAAAKKLDEDTVQLAVIAHIRHTETDYDSLLAAGYDRQDARMEVRKEVDRITWEWKAEA